MDNKLKRNFKFKDLQQQIYMCRLSLTFGKYDVTLKNVWCYIEKHLHVGYTCMCMCFTHEFVQQETNTWTCCVKHMNPIIVDEELTYITLDCHVEKNVNGLDTFYLVVYRCSITPRPCRAFERAPSSSFRVSRSFFHCVRTAFQEVAELYMVSCWVLCSLFFLTTVAISDQLI